ncbi:MAG: hypothetical protein R2827_02725 [Bdellovibrionales bacterium]
MPRQELKLPIEPNVLKALKPLTIKGLFIEINDTIFVKSNYRGGDGSVVRSGNK